MLGQFGLSAAELGLGAEQFDIEQTQMARDLYNQYGLQGAQAAIAADQANIDARAREFELAERAAQMAGSQALDWASQRTQFDLSEAELQSRNEQFLAQLEADLGMRDLDYDIQARQMQNQARQDAARQNLEATMAYSPLVLESQRLADEAAFRGGQLDLGAGQADRDAYLAAAAQRAQQAGLACDLGRAYDERAAGQARQAADQAVLDLAYEDYMRRVSWPQDQLNWLTGMLSAAPQSQQSYTASPGPSTMNQLLGLGLGAGMLGNLFPGGQ